MPKKPDQESIDTFVSEKEIPRSYRHEFPAAAGRRFTVLTDSVALVHSLGQQISKELRQIYPEWQDTQGAATAQPLPQQEASVTTVSADDREPELIDPHLAYAAGTPDTAMLVSTQRSMDPKQAALDMANAFTAPEQVGTDPYSQEAYLAAARQQVNAATNTQSPNDYELAA